MGHTIIIQLIAFTKVTGKVGNSRGQVSLNFAMERLLKLFGKMVILTILGLLHMQMGTFTMGKLIGLVEMEKALIQNITEVNLKGFSKMG